MGMHYLIQGIFAFIGILAVLASIFNWDWFFQSQNSHPVIVEKDLAKAIDEDIIKGAALDVFEVEPIKEENPLLSVKNKHKLILSPHIAWASVEARERLFNEVIENIRAFYKGELRNRIDK